MVISIQCLRGLAALLVVMHHAAWKGEQYSTSSFDWFNVGEAGVDLFFIISGYIMCHTTNQKKVGFVRFLKARFIRIIPLYWVLTTFAFGVYLFIPDRINSSGGVTSLIHSYTLLPTADKYLIQNGWTLSYEFYFYFLFAMGLSSAGFFKYLKPALLIIGVVVIGALFDFKNHQLDFLTDPLLLEFLFGMSVFCFYQKYKIKNGYAWFLILTGVGLFACVNFVGSDVSRVVKYGLPSLFLFSGMVGLECAFKNKQNDVFIKMLKKLGDSSYSLYLVHPFVLALSALVLVKLGLSNDGYLFVFSLVSISVLGGYLCYIFLEKTLVELFKSPSRKKV